VEAPPFAVAPALVERYHTSMRGRWCITGLRGAVALTALLLRAGATSLLDEPPDVDAAAPRTTETNRAGGTPLLRQLELTPRPLEVPTNAADVAAWATNGPAPLLIDAGQVDALLEHVRSAYDASGPYDRFDPAEEQLILEAARRQLETSFLKPPSTNVEDYRQPEVIAPPVMIPDEGDAITFSSERGTLSVSSQGDVRTFTLRDTDGNVIFDGPVTTQEDRQKLPPDAWKKYYEWEKQQRTFVPAKAPRGR
jgi:hypothetical protein